MKACPDEHTPWGRVGTRASALTTTCSRPSPSPPGPATERPRGACGNPVAFRRARARGGDLPDRCWGCHGRKADGHGPNAADIQPRPRNLRNTPFVRSLSYLRIHESIKYGVQGTAMPAAGFDFALDDKAIGDLVNYI
jgi:hypothetical protein